MTFCLFSYTQSPSPRGANSFVLELSSFQEEDKTILTDLHPLKMYYSPLYIFDFEIQTYEFIKGNKKIFCNPVQYIFNPVTHTFMKDLRVHLNHFPISLITLAQNFVMPSNESSGFINYSSDWVCVRGKGAGGGGEGSRARDAMRRM